VGTLKTQIIHIWALQGCERNATAIRAEGRRGQGLARPKIADFVLDMGIQDSSIPAPLLAAYFEPGERMAASTNFRTLHLRAGAPSPKGDRGRGTPPRIKERSARPSPLIFAGFTDIGALINGSMSGPYKKHGGERRAPAGASAMKARPSGPPPGRRRRASSCTSKRAPSAVPGKVLAVAADMILPPPV